MSVSIQVFARDVKMSMWEMKNGSENPAIFQSENLNYYMEKRTDFISRSWLHRTLCSWIQHLERPTPLKQTAVAATCIISKSESELDHLIKAVATLDFNQIR